MKTSKWIVGLVCLPILLAACSKQENKYIDTRKDQTPGAEKPLGELKVEYYEQNGRRMRVTDADGAVISEGLIVSRLANVWRSKGFVAYTYEDQGKRLKVINHEGKDLLFESNVMDENSKVYISDRIVAVTYEDEGTRLKAVNADGEIIVAGSLMPQDFQVYISEKIVGWTGTVTLEDGKSLGNRLYAYNYKGASIRTDTRILDADSKVLISGNIIGYTATMRGPGELLEEKDGVKTFATQALGKRFASYVWDGRELESWSHALSDKSEVRVEELGVVITNVPVSVQGELLKEENGIKTFEANVTGFRDVEIFPFDLIK
jgi:hypothetical protein